ncbi:GAP family protein [Rhodococcus sp. ABRD24]|uniref:GAP family protein n=1 Tax=Rhodococcus sp. ABRD24 TaxID=2507582 RepID=UPI00104050D8|nr:GAP family protein [Rhodococcus sp. ABRD24]QBJ96432.1 GAP family protein [Rhodococcus sp. ABRD24]
MNTVIGDLLPLAVAIAISPVPIIGATLLLMGPRARVLGPCFLIGWVLGVLTSVVAFTLLAGVLPESSPSEGQPVVGTVQLLLGATLLGMAVRQMRSRPQPDDEQGLPAWMTKFDTMRPGASLGTAALLAAVSPKNLFLAIAAGSVLGTSGLGVGSVAICISIFVAVASLMIAVPTVGYLVAPERAVPLLDSIRTWLASNNATIMAVLLLVLGTKLIGSGLGAL